MKNKQKTQTHLLKGKKILSLISFTILWKSALYRYWKYLQLYTGTQAKRNWDCIYITHKSLDCAKLICQTKTFLLTLLSEEQFWIYLESNQNSMRFRLQPHSSWALLHSFHGIFYLMNSALQNKIKSNHSKVNPLYQFSIVFDFQIFWSPPPQSVRLLRNSLNLQPIEFLNYPLQTPHH